MPPRVFLYDGDCGFCSSCARWLQRRVPSPVPVKAWQHVDIAALGLTAAECDTAVRWVDGDRHAAGPAAIAALLRTSNRVWRIVGRLLATPVATALTWPPYRWVARHRDRMPGGTATCALPAAERAARGSDTGVGPDGPAALLGGPTGAGSYRVLKRPLDRGSSL